MAEPGKTFNPYSEWLKIPPSDQPPDHYVLLGLGRFEDDPQRIDEAAKKRMAYLHQLAGGPNRQAVQQLLGEIASARRTLCNVEAKQAYDQQLLNPTPIPQPTREESEAVPGIQIAIETQEPKKRGQPASKRRAKQPEPETPHESRKPASRSRHNLYMLASCSVLIALIMGLIIYRNLSPRRVAAQPSSFVADQRAPQSVQPQTRRSFEFESRKTLEAQRDETFNSLLKASSEWGDADAAAKPLKKNVPSLSSKPAASPAKTAKSNSKPLSMPIEPAQVKDSQIRVLASFAAADQHPFDPKKFLSQHFSISDERLEIVPVAKSRKPVTLPLAGKKLSPGQAVSLRTSFPVENQRDLQLGWSVGGVRLILQPQRVKKKENRLALMIGGKRVAEFTKLGAGPLMLTVYRPEISADHLCWMVAYRDEAYGGRVKAAKLADNSNIALVYRSPRRKLESPLWIDEVRFGPLADPPDLSATRPIVVADKP